MRGRPRTSTAWCWTQQRQPSQPPVSTSRVWNTEAWSSLSGTLEDKKADDEIAYSGPDGKLEKSPFRNASRKSKAFKTVVYPSASLKENVDITGAERHGVTIACTPKESTRTSCTTPLVCVHATKSSARDDRKLGAERVVAMHSRETR